MRNFGWVREGRLAGMGFPSPGDWSVLAEAGVGAALSLTERPPPGSPRKAGLAWLHVPIPDFGTPSIEDLDRCVRWIAEQQQDGRAVVVHCMGGHGRSGLVLAAALVGEGLEAEEAVAEVRACRPGSIETGEQLALVHRYAGQRKAAEREGGDA